MGTFAITSTVRSYPKLPYQKMKDDILGKGYRLSLVFVGTQRAHTLNRTYRKKSYVPNVLSFPLSDQDGEVFITTALAQRECHKFNLSYSGYVGFLYIHALLHLKGLDHGATMEKAEARYVKKYDLR